MAVIQKIREKSWLLLVLLGLAMILFVVDPSSINTRRPTNTILEIDNNEIEYNQFQKKVTSLEEFSQMQRSAKLDENTRTQIQHQAVEELMNETILENELRKLGLSVHRNELFDMVEGENPHYFVQQLFRNPNTGQVNRAELHNFLKAVIEVDDHPYRQYWLFIEDMIYKGRLREKYNNLITKGLYATTLEGKRKKIDDTKRVDVLYTPKLYSAISDSSVVVTDADLKRIYERDKKQYKSEESRAIKYITINVLPSQDDYKEAERKINDIQTEFRNIEASESKQYVTFNSDKPYDPTNYVKGELSSKLDSFAFNSEIGAVYGPYFEDESYKLAKLTSKKQIPDSVKIRHILLPFDQSNFQQVQQLSDSLADLIKDGANFAELAQVNSIDEETKNIGGDLGWMTEQNMTRSNGSAIKDSCFLKTKGHVFTFATQAGIRIIQISNQSRPVTKVQVGILAKEVTPGTKTRQKFYSEASEFAGRNKTLASFEKAANEAGYYINDVPNLKQSTRSISGIPGSRQIVRWAFNTAETGSISSPFDFNDSYYVVALVEAREDGYRSFEDLRDILTAEAIKEKKAEKLMAELKSAIESATSIDDIASKAGSRVVDATNVSFRNISIGEANNELSLIGAATTADAGILKQPIKGEYGVYVLSIENINEPPVEQLTGDFTFERQTIERSYTRNLGYGGLNTVLQELAHVKEHRTLFF